MGRWGRRGEALSVYLGKGWEEKREGFSPWLCAKGERGAGSVCARVRVRVHVCVHTRGSVHCPGFLCLIISLPI